MKGKKTVITALNGLLTHEMSSADQYFIHSRMYQDWGLEELYERMSTFAGHLERVGSSLGRSVDSYNKAVGSFDSRVLPSVRKFSELGIQAKTEVPEAQQIERLPRTVQSNSDNPSDAH